MVTKIEVKRLYADQGIPNLEQRIERIARDVAKVKGDWPSYTMIKYTLTKDYPVKLDDDTLAQYNRIYDFFVFSDGISDPVIFHELTHKFQNDYRLMHGFYCNKLDKILIEGDAYRLMAEYEGIGVRKFLLTVLSSAFQNYILGFLSRNNKKTEKGKLMFKIAKGMAYTKLLHNLKGEELVNYALIKYHKPRLLSIKSLLKDFYGKQDSIS